MFSQNDAFAALNAVIAATQDTAIPNGEPRAAAGALRLFTAIAAALPGKNRDAVIDSLLAALDAVITKQCNAVMHHPSFLNLERAWRSLRYLVDRVDTSQNIRLVFANISLEDLRADFEDSPDISRSGFFKHVYAAEYGQYGGQPVAAVIAAYSLTASRRDMDLLQQAARVGAMAHAPVIAATDKAFFGIDSWDKLADMDTVRGLFDLPHYAAWKRFRAGDTARYAVLTLPCFLLRLPYGRNGISSESFFFEENVRNADDLCWGSSSFFLAARMAESFAEHRWCANITGVGADARIHTFPAYDFAAAKGIQSRIPTGLIISEKREHELAEQGFMPLVLRRGIGDAAFFSTSSCYDAEAGYTSSQRDADAILGHRLSGQLAYMMIANRLAHYIKVIQRENLGLWRDEKTIEHELNKWISLYVTEMDDPDPVTRCRRPLREARVRVYAMDEASEWYTVNLQVKPHFKYFGASFTLSLMSRLDV